MPNHVQNRITFDGNQEQIKDMLNDIKNDDYGIGTIDFNKVIPMPSELAITCGSDTDNGLKAYHSFVKELIDNENLDIQTIDVYVTDREREYLKVHPNIKEDVFLLGKQAFLNIQNYGSPTWYEWSINNWGTKWNAYGYEEGVDYNKADGLYFQTAWAAPHPILCELSKKYPEITFEHQWADEDLGVNCGECSYSLGERVSENWPDSEKEAIELACNVWGYDLEDLGLILNRTGTTYIHTDYEFFQHIELLGQEGLFTEDRLSEDDVPEGLYLYHLRHDDIGNISAVEPQVVVNHAGSVIVKDPIDFGPDNCICFSEENDINFLAEDMSFDEFLNSDDQQTLNLGG